MRCILRWVPGGSGAQKATERTSARPCACNRADNDARVRDATQTHECGIDQTRFLMTGRVFETPRGLLERPDPPPDPQGT
eukprot:208990-Pyramimonas_sp.AAC.1